MGHIEDIIPSNSIIFLGSGFSLGAQNILGKSPPNGKSLRRHFIQQLNLPEDTEYDLQILSEEFADNNPEKLREELYNIFRLKELSEDQKIILSKPWRRIYSTNYDDAVELYRLQTKNAPNSYDVSEAIPNKLQPGAVIHLHGSIRLITAENLTESLVLGEASYVNQYVVRSPWYDQFQSDLAYASGIYIIGYSLADYHIAALMMANPRLAERTFFIQGPDKDEVFLRRTKTYGQTLFIGTAGFAQALENSSTPPVPSISSLKSFRSLAPNRDNKAVSRPTATEVYDLLVYGNFDPVRLARSQPKEDYAISRAEAVREAADAIEENAALVVDGRLGNGKSIFMHLLAYELSARGWTCLMLRPEHPNLPEEMAILSTLDRVIVFVEQYSAAQDTLKGFHSALPDAKLVVEVRTGTFEVRFHELSDLLPAPFSRVSLNTLSGQDVRAFRNLCGRAGLQVLDQARNGDLRDVLLHLFKNKSIRDRLQSALKPLFDNAGTRRILTMTLLVAIHQVAVGAAFVRSVVREDPYIALKLLEDLSHEIFETSGDKIKVRSAVFSSFVVSEFIEPEEIAEAVVSITLAAAERRNERSYRILMSNMIAYSSLRNTLRGKGDARKTINSIYERLRYDERVNGEPLFWLQYAIYMAEVPRLDTAEEYIDTAYRKAEENPGFQTYQIDTQALRIALLRATEEKGGQDITSIQRIIDGLERIDAMLSEKSHRAYAVRVLEWVPPFLKVRFSDLGTGERTAMQFWLLKVINSLVALPEDYKATTGSEIIRKKLESSAKLFLL